MGHNDSILGHRLKHSFGDFIHLRTHWGNKQFITMKQASLNLYLLLSLLQPLIPNAQTMIGYDTQNPTVIAQQDGFQYTEGLFQQGLQFTEFVLNCQISAEDRARGKAEAIADFKANPQAFIAEATQIDQTMQQVYQIAEPLTVAGVRSSLMCQLYVALREVPDNLFIQWEQWYNPVLAYDVENSLVFTERDFQGILQMHAFESGLSGIEPVLTDDEVMHLRQRFVQEFLNHDVRHRRLFSSMAVVAEYTQQAFMQLSPTEREHLRNKMKSDLVSDDFLQVPDMPDYTAVEWPEGVNTQAEKQAYLAEHRTRLNANAASFNILQDVSVNNHALMLNMVENMNSVGDYWEVKYNY